MGFVGHGAPFRTAGSLTVEALEPEPDVRVNWLFSGVLLGAGSWLLLLGVIFAAIGYWIVAGTLLLGAIVCAGIIWRAAKRLARARRSGTGRHRAAPASVEAA